MQMAEKNITKRLDDLKIQFNQQRQTTITEELLDIVAVEYGLSCRSNLQASQNLQLLLIIKYI
jgi:hypothetical protein